MSEQRYVTKRVKKGGRLLWYWDRKGHVLTKLPDDAETRDTIAARLNAYADLIPRQPTGKKATDPHDRFMAKIRKDETTGCWIWGGSTSAMGYGSFKSGRQISAHRVAYEMFVGPIPAGLHIDHKCRNPSCVNPEHLEPVTARENAQRGVEARLLEQIAADSLNKNSNPV